MEDLSKILEKVESLESKVKKAQSSKKKSSVWGWVVALVVGAAVSIGVALLRRKLNKKNEELAELRTTAELRKVEASNLAFSAKITKNDNQAKRLALRSAKLQAAAKGLEGEIDKEREKLQEVESRLRAVKAWKDLEKENQ